MFGDFIKQERIKAGLSLRAFCKSIDYDASNWSKVERGKLPPPHDKDTLLKIAIVLNIEENTDKWQELKDKASIDAGIIPEDLLSDTEMLKKLPMFFRTLRSERPDQKDIDKLINNGGDI